VIWPCFGHFHSNLEKFLVVVTNSSPIFSNSTWWLSTKFCVCLHYKKSTTFAIGQQWLGVQFNDLRMTANFIIVRPKTCTTFEWFYNCDYNMKRGQTLRFISNFPFTKPLTFWWGNQGYPTWRTQLQKMIDVIQCN